MRPERRQIESGFTLVEVIIVLAVVSILVGTAAPLGTSVINRSNRDEVLHELEDISEALQEYYYDRAEMPTTLTDPSFLGPYLNAGTTDTAVQDSWGGNHSYVYRLEVSPDAAIIRSRGPDGLDDGGARDDIAVTVSSSPPGNRKTRARMRLIVEVLANYIEGGGALTGDWPADRESMGLGDAYDTDGFGTSFSLDPATFVLRSNGADRVARTSDDITT